MNKYVKISKKELNANNGWDTLTVGTYINGYKKYSEENSLVYKPINNNITKTVPNDFYLHRIPLTNKKPFDKIMDKMAVEMLKKSGLVLYVNSVMNRFEIYSTLSLLDEGKVINDEVDNSYVNIHNISNLKSFCANNDSKITEIVSNIVFYYTRHTPMKNDLAFLYDKIIESIDYIGGEISLFSSLEKSINETLFKFGYLDTINMELRRNPNEDGDGDCNRFIHKQFSYDYENASMNTDCFFVISKNRIDKYDDLFTKDSFEDYIYKDINDDNFDTIYCNKIIGFYESDYLNYASSMKKRDYHWERHVFKKLAIQAFLGMALNVIDDYETRS